MTPSDGTQRVVACVRGLAAPRLSAFVSECEFQRTSQKPSVPGLVDGRLGTGCASNGIQPLDSSVKILAIRLARFGDLVLLLPALALLKARLPSSHLTLLTDTRWAPLADDVSGNRSSHHRGSDRDAGRPCWRAIAGMLRLTA